MNNQDNKLNYAIHPGRILKEYLNDNDITQKKLAEMTGLHKTIVNEIINGKRSITPYIASLLENVFTMKSVFWLNLQSLFNDYQLRQKVKSSVNSNTSFKIEIKNTHIDILQKELSKSFTYAV